MAHVLITTGCLSTLCPPAIVSRTVFVSGMDKRPRDTYRKITSSVVPFSSEAKKLKAAWKPKLWLVFSVDVTGWKIRRKLAC